jgi:elongation factor 3
VSNLVVVDVNTREFKKLEAVYKNYLKLDDDKAQECVGHFKGMFADSAQADTVEDGIEIVNAEFSLAYGGRMLLNKTILRLFKGHRYGLCGRNGAGKSTLMRSIAEGKLEGFPDKTELRTCFVEHKLQGSEADLDIISFIASDPDLASIDRSDISKALHEVGFDDERQEQKVGSLSGGWKMKLELARAVLMKADVLLLDEPTNHLDVKNVQWLIEYLNSHTEITSLIVSHDSGFLDAVCTDIIHYESKKLVYYKGNLSE